MAKLEIALRAAAAACVLLAGSCAAPMNGADSPSADPVVNHPIAVEPGMQSLRLSYSAADQGLMPDDAAHLENFLADYRLHGNGSIIINAPQGQASHAAIAWFAERIAAFGVSRDRILVATREAPGDFKVELSFISYHALHGAVRRLVGEPRRHRRQPDAEEFRLLGAAQSRRHGRRSARPAGTAAAGWRRCGACRQRDRQLRTRQTNSGREGRGSIGRRV